MSPGFFLSAPAVCTQQVRRGKAAQDLLAPSSARWSPARQSSGLLSSSGPSVSQADEPMPALTSAPARRLPARTSPSDHLRLSWWQCARTTRPLHARWADPRRRVSRQTRAMAGATENYSIWLVPQGKQAAGGLCSPLQQP